MIVEIGNDIVLKNDTYFVNIFDKKTNNQIKIKLNTFRGSIKDNKITILNLDKNVSNLIKEIELDVKDKLYNKKDEWFSNVSIHELFRYNSNIFCIENYRNGDIQSTKAELLIEGIIFNSSFIQISLKIINLEIENDLIEIKELGEIKDFGKIKQLNSPKKIYKQAKTKFNHFMELANEAFQEVEYIKQKYNIEDSDSENE